ILIKSKRSNFWLSQKLSKVSSMIFAPLDWPEIVAAPEFQSVSSRYAEPGWSERPQGTGLMIDSKWFSAILILSRSRVGWHGSKAKTCPLPFMRGARQTE